LKPGAGLRKTASARATFAGLAAPQTVPISASAAREIVAILKRAAGIRVDPGNTQFLSFRL